MLRVNPWPLEAAIERGTQALSRTLLAPRGPRPAAAPRIAARRRTEGLRILIVTDAWRPQVNGVVRTLESERRFACRLEALSIRPEVRAFALKRTWRACAEQFLENLAY